jgi:hypothetical protein
VANQATGGHLAPYRPLLHLAWQGDQKKATTLMSATLREVNARDEGQAPTVAHYARAVVFKGLGRYEDALKAARFATSYPWDLALSLCGDALCAGEVRR